MAEFLPDLVARLRLDTSDLDAGVGRAAAVGGAIGGVLGSLVASGVSSALSAVSNFVSGSVEAFSELEDSSAAAGVVFGDSMALVIEQSKTAASALGLSEQAVINAANTFGTFGKSAGLSGAELATFSTDLTGLAADMASFKGTSPEQAIQAIGAALRGESEPIRAYGVLLDDATLKARAMEMGLYDGNGALNAQQKVLAAQAEIFAQTGDAQGDFARTSESTANVAKTLAAETENLQAKFGTLLAPAFTAARNAGIDFVRSLSGTLDELIPKFQAFYDRASETMSGLSELFSSGDITSGLLSGLGVEEDSPLIGFLLTIRDTAISVASALGPALAGVGSTIGDAFAAIGPQLAAAAAPLGEAFAAIIPVIVELAPQVLQLVSAFSPLGLLLDVLVPILPTLAAALSQVLTAVLGAAQALLPVLLTVAQTLSAALVGALMQLVPVLVEVATMLAGTLGEALSALLPVIMQVVPVVAQLAATFAGVLAGVIAAVAPIIAQLAAALIELLPPILGLIDPVLQVVTALLPLVGVVGELIGALLPPLLELFMAVIVPVAELAGVLATALAPLLTLVASIISGALVPILTTLVGWVGNVITWLLQLAGPALGAVVGAIGNVIGWVARIIGSIASWVQSVGGVGEAVRSMATVVGQRIGEVVAWFTGLPGRVVSAIGNLATTLYSKGVETIRGFIDGITSMGARIISAIRNTITDKLPSFVKSALGISSPSRVFRRLGEETGRGFALGIEGMTQSVGAAAQGMVDAVGGVDVPDVNMGALRLDSSLAARNINPDSGDAARQRPVQVRVWLGNEELTSRMRVQVLEVLDEEASAIAGGSVT